MSAAVTLSDWHRPCCRVCAVTTAAADDPKRLTLAWPQWGLTRTSAGAWWEMKSGRGGASLDRSVRGAWAGGARLQLVHFSVSGVLFCFFTETHSLELQLFIHLFVFNYFYFMCLKTTPCALRANLTCLKFLDCVHIRTLILSLIYALDM